MTSPLRVLSIDEEDTILGNCRCGSDWAVASEDVVPVQHRWYDALVVRCDSCGSVQRAVFDNTAFFEPRIRAWLHATG
jgi:hypothetical protein